MAAVAVAALGLAGAGAIPASASTASAGSVAAPSSAVYDYFCTYTVNAVGIGLWAWPGGSARDGNTRRADMLVGLTVNSIPWVSTGSEYGQRWIYGSINTGTTTDGWVGRNYLTLVRCGHQYFQSTNWALVTGQGNDEVYSHPTEVWGPYQGQDWVYGNDTARSAIAGWIGKNYLTLQSCDPSTATCWYKMKQDGIHVWVLPGGASG